MLLPADLTESISGSEASTASDAEASTSTSSDSDNGGANLTRLLRKQHLVSSSSPANQGDEEDDLDVLTAGPRTALQWFETPGVPPPDTQYGIHRAALPRAGARKRPFPGQEEGQAVLQELKELQLGEPEPQAQTGEGGGEEERKWTLLMFGGGHFAGMVVSLRPKLVKSSKKGSKEKEREVVVLHKKTFHRYTSTAPPFFSLFTLAHINVRSLIESRHVLLHSSTKAGRLTGRQRLGEREGQIGRSPNPSLQRGDAQRRTFMILCLLVPPVLPFLERTTDPNRCNVVHVRSM